MTDRLQREAERVAAEAQPPEVREPWLAYNAELADLLSTICLSLEEIKRGAALQNSAVAVAIASGLEAYAAGDQLHRAAAEAASLARDVRLQGQINTLVERGAAAYTRMHTHIEDVKKAMLEELAKIAARQARIIKRAQESDDDG